MNHGDGVSAFFISAHSERLEFREGGKSKGSDHLCSSYDLVLGQFCEQSSLGLLLRVVFRLLLAFFRSLAVGGFGGGSSNLTICFLLCLILIYLQALGVLALTKRGNKPPKANWRRFTTIWFVV